MKKLFAALPLLILFSSFASTSTSSSPNIAIPLFIKLILLLSLPILVSCLVIWFKYVKNRQPAVQQKTVNEVPSQINYLVNENKKLESDLEGLYFLWHSAKDELQTLQNLSDMTERLPKRISKKMFEHETEELGSSVEYSLSDSIQHKQSNPS